MDESRAVGRWGVGRLAALTVLVAAVLLPASAQGRAAFTFVPDPYQPSLPAGSRLVDVADLAGNGIPDLVIVNAEENAVGVMLGDGAGGFGAPTWYPVAGHPAFVRVADFNNDGHADLLVPVETVSPAMPYPNPLPDQVEILFGNGQGSFTAGPLVKLPAIGPVYTGDFTGNGNVDVVVGPSGCFGRGSDSIYRMLLGDGHGNLTPGPVYTSPVSTPDCRSFVGDFTGNGRDDILTETANSRGEEPAIVVLPGEPDGTFASPIVSPTPQLGHHLSFVSGVADLDADGRLDVVVRTLEEPLGRVEVFKGNGAGGFSETGSYPSEQPGRFSFEVALADFEVDGHVDIATIGSQLSVLANNGAGIFSPIFTTPLGGGAYNGFVADVNHDGRPDLIMPMPMGLQILLNEPVAPLPGLPVQSSVPSLAPVIRDARESARRWREGGALAQTSRRRRGKPGVGTTFSFWLNESATVRFRFTQRGRGHEVGRGCLASEGTGLRIHTSCRRVVSAGTFSVSARSGTNRVAFQGRLTARRKLRPGTYTLIIQASNSAGISAPASLHFTIVK